MATWAAWRIAGFEYWDTGINEASKGVASVHVIRSTETDVKTPWASHDSNILFTFVLHGEMRPIAENHGENILHQGDAFVMPPGLKHQINAPIA